MRDGIKEYINKRKKQREKMKGDKVNENSKMNQKKKRNKLS